MAQKSREVEVIFKDVNKLSLSLLEVSNGPWIVEWVFHVLKTHDRVWLKELKREIDCWDHWIREKFTYERESFFFDDIRIKVWIVVSDRVPENLLGIASGPAKSYQPVDGFFMKVSIHFGLFKLLFKELFVK